MFIYNFKKWQKGFTLVEMMVAIAVFSVVMVVAMGALINVISADQKAQSIKTAVDNVSFALESISKDMRVGTEYNCFYNGTWVGDCTGAGSTEISYYSPKEEKYVFYQYVSGTVGQIERCDGTKNFADGCTDFTALTSSEVNITNLKFYVTGTAQNSVPNKTQPRVIITLSGTAGAKASTQTSFDLQTSVSQRIRNN